MVRLGRWLDRHPLIAIVLAAAMLSTIAGTAITVGRELDDEPPAPRLAPGSAMLSADELATLMSAGGPFEGRLTLWCNFIDLGDLDLRTLPRVGDAGTPTQPVDTLAEAVKASPVIIQGRVRAWWMEGCDVFALVDVERSIGTTDRLVRIWMGMQIVPGRDWSEALLVDSHVVHTYLPGDEVILFLVENQGEIAIPRGSLYHSLAFTSSYRVRDGRVEALPKNPFSAGVDGESEDEFWNQLKSINR